MRPDQYGSIGNPGTACDIDESGSPIRDGVSTSESLLGEIQDAITRLEKRLDTVLTPAPPTACAESKPAPRQLASHLTSRVVGFNDALSVALQRLHAVTRRIEV